MKRIHLLGAGVATLSMIWAGLAVAQTATNQVQGDQTGANPNGEARTEAPVLNAELPIADPSASTQDVVVTGTLIRGVAPVGTQVIGISNADIKAIGAPAAKDLLAKIPQVSNFFNRIPATGADFGQVNTAPQLRGLGGGTTLFLIDGHRVAPYGAISDAIDADVVPSFVLERVEIVPDGGSSIYGSDGIAGVINYITKRRFEGVSAEAHYGFADKYHTWDTSVAGGQTWGDVSAYVAYTHSQHDEIFNRDRDYARAFSGSLARTCSPGNVLISGTYYSAATFTTPGQLCDVGLNAALYPREKRDSFFSGLSYDGPGWTFDVKGYYTHRTANSYTNQRSTSSGVITRANPFFRSINGEGTQTVVYNYASVFGLSNRTSANIHEYGIAPSFTADLPADFKLRISGYAGHSDTTNRNPQINVAAEQAALASTNRGTALNPYDLTQTNAAILQGIGAFEQYAKSNQKLGTARAVVDGALFTIPGGSVRVAAGTEYIYQKFDARAGTVVTGNYTSPAIMRGVANRKVAAVFGEIVAPIFSQANAVAGIQQLTLSASGRYDHYNSFGSVFNPKFSATYSPFVGLKVRGNYSKAFNAPLLQDVGAADTRSFLTTAAGFGVLFPGDSTTNSARPLIVLAGGDPNLQPQRARIWTVGADIQPEFVPGLTISGTYYNVNFNNQITILFPATVPTYYTEYLNRLIIRNPTLAQAQSFTAGVPVSGYDLAALYAANNAPYAVVDFRRHNFGNVRQRGMDLSADYNRPTSFGSINASIGGTYILKKTQQNTPSVPYSNILVPNTSRLSLSSTVGATVGDFDARLSWFHSGGYRVNNLVNQTHVGSFDTFNLFTRYSLNGTGFMSDTALTLNLDNIFDAAPPRANNAAGFINGSTLGRLVQFGISKKF